MLRSRGATAVLVIGAVTAVLAGCGNDGGSAGAGGSSASPSSSTATGPAAPVTAGTAADQSKSPVLVGFHSVEGGGAFSLPNVREGFEAGIKYVNAELGGINGHPVKAVLCKTQGTPESTVNCGNQFVSQRVVASVQGIDFGTDAILPVLKSAKVAEIGAVALTPALNAAVGDAYMIEYSSQEGYASTLVNSKARGSTSEVQLYSDNPAQRGLYDNVIKPAAERLGLKTTPFFYPTPADWTTTAATALTSKPTSITLFAADTDCLAAIPALRNGGFKGTINLTACTSLIKTLPPAMLKNVYFANATYTNTITPVPAEVQADLDTYNRYVKDVPGFGKPNFQDNQAIQGYLEAVTVADMLRQIPGEPLTAQAVYDGLGKTKGDIVFRTTGYDCSKPTWPGTTACGSGTIFAESDADRRLIALPNQPLDISGIKPAS